MKQSFSLRWELSNGMLNATFTQGNRGDTWLLVVGSQTTNLASDPSFGHNLCFKCLNESCEPILDIYVPRNFQWYKELLNPMCFDLFNCSLKIRKSMRTLILKMGVHLGVWMFILTLSHTLDLPSWPAPLQALALVTSPRLGLRHDQNFLTNRGRQFNTIPRTQRSQCWHLQKVTHNKTKKCLMTN
jgi:hypothetical protein